MRCFYHGAWFAVHQGSPRECSLDYALGTWEEHFLGVINRSLKETPGRWYTKTPHMALLAAFLLLYGVPLNSKAFAIGHRVRERV